MKGSKNTKELNIIFLGKKSQIPKLLIIRFSLSIIGFIVSLYFLIKFFNDGIPRQFEIIVLIFFAILIFILHIIDRKYFPRIKNGVPILRYDVSNKDVKSKSDLLLEGITPTNPHRTSLFNVHVEMDNNTDPLAMRIYKTKENYVVGEAFTLLEPKTIRDLGILIKPEETFNFQFDNAGIVKKLSITEIYTP